MGKKVYFAGPLFNLAEKEFNVKVAGVLEKSGYTVFLPQRDGFEAAALEGLTEIEKVEKIFDKDTAEIRAADVLFMVLDGRVPDDGACVELGIAYALGKPCYGIKTDVRALEIDMALNPLIAGCFKKIFVDKGGETALDGLKNFLAKSQL